MLRTGFRPRRARKGVEVVGRPKVFGECREPLRRHPREENRFFVGVRKTREKREQRVLRLSLREDCFGQSDAAVALDVETNARGGVRGSGHGGIPPYSVGAWVGRFADFGERFFSGLDARHRKAPFRHENDGRMFARIGFGDFEGFGDRVDRSRKEHVVRERFVEARNENVVGFFQGARDRVGFVRADAEIRFEFRLDGFGGLQAPEGFFKHGGSRPFDAFRQENHHAPVAHRARGVFHCLLHLIDVDVLGVAAAGGDHEVGRLRNHGAVDAVDEFARFAVGGAVVAREHADEAVTGVEDRVEEKERAAFRKERHSFHLVFVAGVAVRNAELRMFVEHEAVVDAHGFHRCAPGENRLAPAAVAREVVVHDRARQNDVVDVAELFVDPDGRTARGGAEVFEVFRAGRNRVVGLQAPRNVRTHLCDDFFVGHFAVRAEGENDLHVRVGNAESVEFVHENGHEVEAVRNARRVVADEGHGVAGLHDLFERGRADRVTYGVEHRFGDVLDNGKVGRAHFGKHVFVGNGKGLGAASVGKFADSIGHGCLLEVGPRPREANAGRRIRLAGAPLRLRSHRGVRKY